MDLFYNPKYNDVEENMSRVESICRPTQEDSLMDSIRREKNKIKFKE